LFKNPTVDFSTFLSPLGNSTCSSPEIVLAFLLYDGSTVHNASDQFVSCVYFFFVDFAFHPSPQTNSDLYAPTSNSCISTPIGNWTHVYMNLFTRNSQLYHHLKYLLLLLKHPVYIGCFRQKSNLYAPTSNSRISTPIQNWIHVYMNSFIRNSQHRHLLKYLLLLLKHPVYIGVSDKNIICTRQLQTAVSPHTLKTGHMFI